MLIVEGLHWVQLALLDLVLAKALEGAPEGGVQLEGALVAFEGFLSSRLLFEYLPKNVQACSSVGHLRILLVLVLLLQRPRIPLV